MLMLFFWDEAPMQSLLTFEAVDRTIRDIMQEDNVVFGGKVIVFDGDFHQVAPIAVRGPRAQVVRACLNKSETIWRNINILPLITNMRTQNQEFAAYLLGIGEGREPTVTFGQYNDYIRIPDDFLFRPLNIAVKSSAEKLLIKAIYPNLDTTQMTPAFMSKRAILSTHNDDIDKLNAIATEMMYSVASATYLSQDSIPDEDDTAGDFATEFLNSLSSSGLPPFRLILKVGQPVVLLRNMDPKHGLCNRTRLVIRALKTRLIDAEIMMGDFRGQTVSIPRIPLTTTDDGIIPVKFRRCQFPLKPAFAMTINKAQGQTLASVGLYVALSRCTNPENLKILIKGWRLARAAGDIHSQRCLQRYAYTT